MVLIRDLTNLDDLELITTPLRTPQYVFDGDRLFEDKPADLTRMMHTLQIEHYGPYDGRLWPFRATEHKELIPSSKSYIPIDRISDLLFGLRFIDSIWTGSTPVDSSVSPLSAHLARTLGQLWDGDGTPLGRLVAGYIQGTYQTPYLSLARSWMKRGMPLKLLDMFLGYTYGPEIVRLMKLPPASAVIDPEWELVPVLYTNGTAVDIWNLDPREPLALAAAQFIRLETIPRLIKRDKKRRTVIEVSRGLHEAEYATSGDKKFRFRLPPPVFFATTLLADRGILQDRGMALCQAERIRHPSLCSFTGMGGSFAYHHPEDELCPDTSEPHPWQPVPQICQLCEDLTAQCPQCRRVDLLFCLAHSGVIEEADLAGRHTVWCYECRDGHLSCHCNQCIWAPIGRCWFCSSTASNLCKKCAGWPQVEGKWLCPQCHISHRCYTCREVHLKTMRCNQCHGNFCSNCNPVVPIDISPGVLWPGLGQIVNAIARVTQRCRQCMTGRTEADIQDEARRNGTSY
jgi:hypothetical protein